MKNRQNFVMEALPTLFYSSLYRSFIIAVEKLLYESTDLKKYLHFVFIARCLGLNIVVDSILLY